MNIRYSLLFLLVLFTSGSIAFAQTSINGKVIDSKTNAPLKGATVRIDGTTIGSLTNKGGSLLNMAIVGGAVVPYIQGQLADIKGLQFAFIIPIACYVYIVYYGLFGTKSE